MHVYAVCDLTTVLKLLHAFITSLRRIVLTARLWSKATETCNRTKINSIICVLQRESDLLLKDPQRQRDTLH